MRLDLFFLALVVLLAVLGLVSGFLSQIVRIVSLVAACFLAAALSPQVKGVLARWMEVDTLLGDALSLVVAWLGCYLVLTLAGKIFVRFLRSSSKSIRFLDRLMGGLLGGAKGLLIVYLLACLLVTFREPAEKTPLAGVLDLKRSQVLDAAARFNVMSLTSLPDMDKLRDLAGSLGDPDRRKALLADPRMHGLQENRALQQLLEDAEFKKAAAEKKFGEMVQNRNFRQALKDGQIREFLSRWIPPERPKAPAAPEHEGPTPSPVNK